MTHLDRRSPAALGPAFVDPPRMGGPPGPVGRCGQGRGVPERGPPRPHGSPAGWWPTDGGPGSLRDHARVTLGTPLRRGSSPRVGRVCPVASGAGALGCRSPRARGSRPGDARGVCRPWEALCGSRQLGRTTPPWHADQTAERSWGTRVDGTLTGQPRRPMAGRRRAMRDARHHRRAGVASHHRQETRAARHPHEARPHAHLGDRSGADRGPRPRGGLRRHGGLAACSRMARPATSGTGVGWRAPGPRTAAIRALGAGGRCRRTPGRGPLEARAGVVSARPAVTMGATPAART